MRLFLALLCLLHAIPALADGEACAVRLGVSGGLVTAEDGARLSSTIVPAIGGRSVSTQGAVLRAHEDGGSCLSSSTATAVDPPSSAPLVIDRLLPLAPNPFNPRTQLRFDLSRAQSVEIALFNVAGRRVRTLVDAFLPAGRHERTVDAGGLASGVYLVRMRSENGTFSRSVVLLK